VLVLAQAGGLKPAMPHVLLSFPVLFDSSRTLGRALFFGLLGPSVPLCLRNSSSSSRFGSNLFCRMGHTISRSHELTASQPIRSGLTT
jgi:hypothetical protein